MLFFSSKDKLLLNLQQVINMIFMCLYIKSCLSLFFCLSIGNNLKNLRQVKRYTSLIVITQVNLNSIVLQEKLTTVNM